MAKLPVVALVGRMNVGKSTLFNRLAENARSITLDYPGVTRDIIKDTVSWRDRNFELVDTGGISLHKHTDKILEQVREKALAAIDKAEVVLLMVDGTVGVLAEDREIAQTLRQKGKHVVLVVNKSDVKKFEEYSSDFYELPHDEVVHLSAEHGLGVNDLLDAALKYLPEGGHVEQKEAGFKVVLLGKPNVGKSSLMNALLEHDRSLVSDIPGTTREALSETISFYKEHLQLTDTAGIRRKRVVDENLEQLMVKSSFHALKNADIALLMIDADQAGIVDQELKLAFYAFEELNKALIIILNKTDLLTEEKERELEQSFAGYEHLMKKIPVLRISCKTGKNVGKILPLIKQVWERYHQELPEEEMNRIIQARLSKTPLVHARQKLEVRKIRQLATAPITIGLQVNLPEWFSPSEIRFFDNILRANYDLIGVPIKFIVRKKL